MNQFAESDKKESISQDHEDDLISRRESIEKLDFYMKSTRSDLECEMREDEMDFYKACHLAKKIITNMPSVQPETPPYVAEIESEYKKWVSMPHINKPLAKALYEVWKKHDREDVSRNG